MLAPKRAPPFQERSQDLAYRNFGHHRAARGTAAAWAFVVRFCVVARVFLSGFSVSEKKARTCPKTCPLFMPWQLYSCVAGVRPFSTCCGTLWWGYLQ